MPERIGLINFILKSHCYNRKHFQITAIFKSYSSKLEKIAYILSPDVHRLIVKEAMMINQSVLANRLVLVES